MKLPPTHHSRGRPFFFHLLPNRQPALKQTDIPKWLGNDNGLCAWPTNSLDLRPTQVPCMKGKGPSLRPTHLEVESWAPPSSVLEKTGGDPWDSSPAQSDVSGPPGCQSRHLEEWGKRGSTCQGTIMVCHAWVIVPAIRDESRTIHTSLGSWKMRNGHLKLHLFKHCKYVSKVQCRDFSFVF